MRKSFLAALLMLAMPVAAPAVPAGVAIPPIFYALDDTNLAKAKAIIAADPKAVNARVGPGVTPLELIANITAKVPYNPMAMVRERIKETDVTNSPIPLVAQLLVEKGADVNAKDDEGDTPLMYALVQKNISLAFWLLDRGADVNVVDHGGGTPLYFACVKVEPTLAEVLMAKGANVKAAEQGGKSPLFWAIMNRETNVAKLLINGGADVNAGVDLKSVKGRTPLHAAMFGGSTNITTALLAAGAKVNARDSLGQTPLFLAAKNSAFKEVGLLLQNGADINARDLNGNTPLKAAEASKKEVGTQLDDDESTLSGYTPDYYYLADRNIKKTISFLKKHGAAE